MKSIVLLIFSFINIVSFTQETTKTFELIGEVKSIEISNYNPITRNGLVEKDYAYGSDKFYFDINGKAIKSEIRYSNTNQTSIFYYKYYKNGKLKSLISYNEQNELISKELYIIRKNKEFHYLGNSKSINIKDSYGNIIEVRNFYDGKLKSIAYNQFDLANNLIGNYVLDNEGLILGGLNYKYDDKNRLTEKKNFYFSNNYSGLNVSTFIYSHNNIKTETIIKNFSLIKKNVRYNKKDKISYEEKVDANNSIIWQAFYDYDLEGNLNVKEEYFYSKGNSRKTTKIWKYFYDEKGNWIKVIEFENLSIPITLQERTIEYY